MEAPMRGDICCKNCFYYDEVLNTPIEDSYGYCYYSPPTAILNEASVSPNKIDFVRARVYPNKFCGKFNPGTLL